MNMFSNLLAVGFCLMLIGWVLYLVFGQITVRRLRKNSETRDALGMELVSGWDIINVARALALPRSWTKKLEGSPLSALYADSDLLRKHTTRLDKALAAAFFWLFMSSGLGLALLVSLNALGMLEG